MRRIPDSEALLDAAVECTFPASDPIAVDHAFKAASERESRARGEEAGEGGPARPATYQASSDRSAWRSS